MEELSDYELVRLIADGLIGKIGEPGKPPETEELQTFSDVYSLDLEIGSGASFEQYFRWSDPEQVARILDQLKELGMEEIIPPVKKAIEVAFPKGIPEDPLEYEDCTDWTEEQDTVLSKLYKDQESSIHSTLEKGLANFARDNELLSMKRFQVLTRQSSGRLKALLRWALRKTFSRPCWQR